jgi:hypothetical protein
MEEVDGMSLQREYMRPQDEHSGKGGNPFLVNANQEIGHIKRAGREARQSNTTTFAALLT